MPEGQPADGCTFESRSHSCKNTEWVMCAIHGKLPGQNTRALRFAKAPGSLVIEEFWRPPAGCVNGACDEYHYAVSDVFYVEACLISFICSNRDQLFEVGVGVDFVCDLDADAYARLQEVAQATV